MIKYDHQLLTVWRQASTFSREICVQKGKCIRDVLFQYQAIWKLQIQKNILHSFQTTVLPSISPPEEDIVLKFRNAVPMASSLVSRSLPRASVNWCLSCYSLNFTYVWPNFNSYQSYMVSLTHSHMDGNWKQTGNRGLCEVLTNLKLKPMPLNSSLIPWLWDLWADSTLGWHFFQWSLCRPEKESQVLSKGRRERA